jgi:hypothetical protein
VLVFPTTEPAVLAESSSAICVRNRLLSVWEEKALYAYRNRSHLQTLPVGAVAATLCRITALKSQRLRQSLDPSMPVHSFLFPT